MRIRKPLAIVAIVALCAPLLRSQAPADDEIRIGTRPYVPQQGTIRVQSELVEVGVVIRDSNGQTVGGFKRDDFQILDNGKAQKVSYFDEEKAPKPVAAKASEKESPSTTAPATPVPAAPRYVAMFFDDTSSPLADLVSARKAAEGYIGKGLEPGEKVGLYTASSFFRLDFTEDTAALLAGLPKILPHVRRAEDAIGCPRINPYQAWAIIHHGYQSQEFQVALAEALACPQNSGVPPFELSHLVEIQAQRTLDIAGQISDGILEKAFNVIKILSAQQGHRVLLFASSGFFAEELQSQREQLVNAALRTKVVINTLDAKGLFVDADLDYSNGPPAIISPDLMVARSMIANTDVQFKNDPLALLAEETGGRFFHNSNDLTRGVQELSASPEVSYVLGFTPENLRQDGAFHALKVKLGDAHGLTISAREGYYAPKKPKDMTADEKLVKFGREVMAGDTLTAIPVNLEVKPTKLQNGDSDLNLASKVDVAKLPFRKENDRSTERLIMVTALFSEKNEFLTGTEQIVDLSLKSETLAKLSRDGFGAKLSVEAPPGNYRVRQVVIEVVSGKMAALNQNVVVQ